MKFKYITVTHAKTFQLERKVFVHFVWQRSTKAVSMLVIVLLFDLQIIQDINVDTKTKYRSGSSSTGNSPQKEQ